MDEPSNIIVPITVALMGLIQVALNLWAGRRNSRASAEKDQATATREVGDAYGGLVEALERRIRALEVRVETLESERNELKERAEALEKENLALRVRVQELESKEVQNGDVSTPIRDGNSESGNRRLPGQASEAEVP